MEWSRTKVKNKVKNNTSRRYVYFCLWQGLWTPSVPGLLLVLLSILISGCRMLKLAGSSVWCVGCVGCVGRVVYMYCAHLKALSVVGVCARHTNNPK